MKFQRFALHNELIKEYELEDIFEYLIQVWKSYHFKVNLSKFWLSKILYQEVAAVDNLDYN